MEEVFSFKETPAPSMETWLADVDFAVPLQTFRGNIRAQEVTASQFGNLEIQESKQDSSKQISVRSMGASDEFTRQVQEALRSLPKYLQDLEVEFQIYVTPHPEAFLLELRNHGVDLDLQSRNQLREHIAETDVVGRLQNFSERFYIPEARRTFEFQELYDIKGTAAHEGLHIWDEQLKVTETDIEFDRLYRKGVERIMTVNSPESLGWLANYVKFDKSGNLLQDGKEELFADLGAIAITGGPANKLVDSNTLKFLFRELNKYVEPKFKTGKWDS